MQFDFMTGSMTWTESANLAKSLEGAGFSGMLFTESGQVPWMMIASAASAAPKLSFSTGIAVAFPRSPMISAQIAWEMAGNAEGRFRLGLGSQVRGHVVRRYGALWDKPAPQMKDYVQAFQACIRAFRREERLNYEGRYYSLTLLPDQWTPAQHEFGDVKIDISAVGPQMCRVAGELCDGLHVHPMHSMPYIQNRLLPDVAKGAERAGRNASDVELMIPVFTIVGDTPEDRAHLKSIARTQVAFYGSTPNYAFQFEDLGFPGVSERLRELMRSEDMKGLSETISDEILHHFSVEARWDDMADTLISRYQGVASRLVTYLAREDLRRRPENLDRWGEVARAVRSA